MRSRLHLKCQSRSPGGLGTMNLADLSTRAVEAIAGHATGDTSVRDEATRLVQALESATVALAERTHTEFSAAADWTVKQRQNHTLRAIVGYVELTKEILAGASLGESAEVAVRDLLRETFFARLAEVARGAHALPGRA